MNVSNLAATVFLRLCRRSDCIGGQVFTATQVGCGGGWESDGLAELVQVGFVRPLRLFGGGIHYRLTRAGCSAARLLVDRIALAAGQQLEGQPVYLLPWTGRGDPLKGGA